ncbi:DUF308 domain-containing protein [Candidatus Pacearchaeota archaeon]|nr:DUF308 domain-containing protein [Candidatus Pacearchaeota archaeon]
MYLRTPKTLGILSLIAGTLFLLNVFTSITGFVIADNIEGAVSILGMAFIALGIVLISYSESEAYHQRESVLRKMIGEEKYEELPERDKYVVNRSHRRHIKAEERREYNRQRELARKEKEELHIIRTENFERAIQGHNHSEIERAINKISKGLGKQERLKHLPGLSIRVSRRGRILYEVEGKEVKLTDYLPDHKYWKGD